MNPLAVTLAKVSLWLETLQRGRPLTFLDAHLRVGDSLVGGDLLAADGRLRLDDVIAWPKTADAGLKEYLKKVAGPSGEAMIEALKARTALKGRRQPTLPGMAAHEVTEAIAELVAERERLTGAPDHDADLFQLELDAEQRFRALERDEDAIRNRVKEAADFWCAQWFWPADPEAFDTFDVDPSIGVIRPPGEGDFQAIIAHLLDPRRTISDDQQARLDVGAAVAAEHRFFHWALEFPEVIVERGGFDVVIGNPPWNTLSPDVKEFFSTFDPLAFKKGVSKSRQAARRAELCEDREVDRRWREEARRLHELGAYVKPKAGRYLWFPEEGNLRKGDANVFRQFVERGYALLRAGGYLAQVLPDSVYVSSPTTELRRRLLSEARLEYCYAFENRRELFPIHRSIKIVLLGAQAGTGPTTDFAVSFITGKDAAGRDRAISLPDLPGTLTALAKRAPRMSREQVETLSPQTLAFPELVTPLDAEIVARVVPGMSRFATALTPNGLHFLAEAHSDRLGTELCPWDEISELVELDVDRRSASNGAERWLSAIGGADFWLLEYQTASPERVRWLKESIALANRSALAADGSPAHLHRRLGWRKVASATNERSLIAAIIPAGVVCRDSAYTVQPLQVNATQELTLAGILASFVCDYLVRFAGRTNLTYGVMNDLPIPQPDGLEGIASIVDAIVRHRDPASWECGQLRATVDAKVALAAGLSMREYSAVLSAFPLLDRTEPPLPREPKSFVTRDVALLAFASELGVDSPDVVELLESAGIELPPPQDDFRDVGHRVEHYRQLGASPYRPTPRGGRPPTDPALIEAVTGALREEPQTVETLADVIADEENAVRKVLDSLVKDGECMAQGRGRTRSYYVMED